MVGLCCLFDYNTAYWQDVTELLYKGETIVCVSQRD
jgi:hypothetical protein